MPDKILEQHRFAVYTQDGNVFFCNTSPVWRSDENTNLIQLEFTPTNGPNRGKLHKFPYARIAHIVG